MTSSYEARIVEAMLRWVDRKVDGDESGMAEALVEAQNAATRLRTERRTAPPEREEDA